MVTSPNEWKILEWDEKLQTNKKETRHLNIECFETAVPANFISYTPTFLPLNVCAYSYAIGLYKNRNFTSLWSVCIDFRSKESTSNSNSKPENACKILNALIENQNEIVFYVYWHFAGLQFERHVKNQSNNTKSKVVCVQTRHKWTEQGHVLFSS